MKTKQIFAFAMGISLLASAGLGSLSAATDSSPVLTAPEKFYISAQPGQKILKKFTVTNRTDSSLQLKIVAKNFRLKNENGQLEFFNDASGMAPWIIPEYLQIGVKPSQSREVSFIIDIPADAAAKGYQGAILLEQTVNNSTKAISGAVILLNVGQTAPVSPTILGIETPKINNSSPAALQMNFKNTGEQNLKTAGTLTLKDWRGRVVEELKNQKIFLVSNSNQKFSWNISNATSVVGFYRAQIQLDDPAKAGSKISAGTWFLVFPWKTTLWVLLGLAILIFFVELGRRLVLKKILAKSEAAVLVRVKK